ncbi:MAG: TIGR03668 family PPOX class F420-dependent oxidoreductase [Alphaproteobacteria bacterium]|nr:TIGR03668 family PPOX class F420-dependent oxidoreductase [Alphaproteobacteria bacterium]
MPVSPTPDQISFLETQRIGRLATADGTGAPHVVPVCYALGERVAYIVLDEKPKRVEAVALKRVRNILENPQAAMVVDHYDDQDWSRLGWVMLRGGAEILEPGTEQAAAVALLRDRYPPYRSMALDERPVIALRVEKVTSWGMLKFPPTYPMNVTPKAG